VAPGKVAIVSTRDVVRSFLDAVESRDVDRAAEYFSENARYENVPHPPVHGPDGVRAMLRTILAASSLVRWDVVSEAYAGNRGHVERIDRFVIDGVEYAVRCHAVIEVDTGTGLIDWFRDYVDLGPWREAIKPALERWRSRNEVDTTDHDDVGANTIG
jgi:limonene-1,2-epoxide hydrolase